MTDMQDWTPWAGGRRPHPPATCVRVRYRDGTEDEGQSAFPRWWHDKNEPWRDIIAFRLGPTAPVEASGSEREEVDFLKSALAFAYEKGLHEIGYDPIERILDLRPQPSGETRESIHDAARRLFAKEYPGRDYDRIDASARVGWMESAWEEREALLSARPAPVASGGQHSGPPLCEDEGCPQHGAPHISTTPARAEAQDEDTPCTDCGDTGVTHQTERRCSCQEAEAQDEGAAGERLLAFADDVAAMSVAIAVSNYTGALADDIRSVLDRTHPSPPPAADADRVRIAVELINAEINAPLTGPTHGAWDRGRIAGLKEALAALKAEGK